MTPFIKILNPVVLDLSPGSLTMSIGYHNDLIGNPRIPCLHGGVIATLIDHCAGFCAWTCLNSTSSVLSTVDLRIDYLAPA
jgi:uncharacterized protein (TIGR00369 family)